MNEKAPGKQEKRKKETKTKRGVAVGKGKMGGGEKKEGGREEEGDKVMRWGAAPTANVAGRESARAL